MDTMALVVGTVLGTALDVAEQLEQALKDQAYTVTLYDGPKAFPEADIVLFCTSTTGRGNLPGSMVPLIQRIAVGDERVVGRRYGIVALGDSRYPTFCGAGRHVDNVMQQQGAIRMGERLELDADDTDFPDEEALAWLPGWLATLKV